MRPICCKNQDTTFHHSPELFSLQSGLECHTDSAPYESSGEQSINGIKLIKQITNSMTVCVTQPTRPNHKWVTLNITQPTQLIKYFQLQLEVTVTLTQGRTAFHR